MRSTVTFPQFHRVLTDLGFEATPVEGSHVAYRHGPTDTVILLPTRGTGRFVAPHDIVSARLLVAGRGVATPDRFNELLATTNGTKISYSA